MGVGKQLNDRTLCSFIGCRNEKCEHFIKSIEDTVFRDVVDFPNCEFWKDRKDELIRCKDCKYWQPQAEGVVEIPICKRLTEEFTGLKGGQFFAMDADDYCSCAEPKGAE